MRRRDDARALHWRPPGRPAQAGIGVDDIARPSKPLTRRPPRNWLTAITASACFAGLVGLLVVAELYAIATDPVPPVAPAMPDDLGLPTELVENDAVLGRSFRPNAGKFFESAHGEFAVNYQINEIGLRESGMISAGKDPQYVVVLGDEFVEGWGVMSEATFTREIERRLRMRPAPGRNVRVLNAGMSGYGAAQSYLLGRRLMQTISVDVIVLVYTSLMPVADFHFLAEADVGDDGIARRAGRRYASAATLAGDDSILQHSALFRLGYSAYDAWRARSNVIPGEPASDLFAAARDSQSHLVELHEQSLLHVGALAQLAETRGVKFILVHLPLPHQVAEDEWLEGRRAYQFAERSYRTPDIDLVEEFCRARALQCEMTAPMLREISHNNASRVYFQYDHTLTKVGHRALVAHLFGTILAALPSVTALHP